MGGSWLGGAGGPAPSIGTVNPLIIKLSVETMRPRGAVTRLSFGGNNPRMRLGVAVTFPLLT